MMVQTTKGDIPIEKLKTVDVVSLEKNARVIATEWRLQGELVRRDVTVSILSGQYLFGEQQRI